MLDRLVAEGVALLQRHQFFAPFCALLVIIIVVAAVTGWPPPLARLLGSSPKTEQKTITINNANSMQDRSVTMNGSSSVAPAADINVQSYNQSGGITAGVVGDVNQENAR